MKVLMHTCCAPCTIYPLKVLKQEGHDVTGFFYNPNIHPFTEFVKRREALISFAATALLPLWTDDSYALEDFLAGALKMGKDRCLYCYRMRLERVFREAAEKDFPVVTTTLLYSKYQRHEEIAEIGAEMGKKSGIAFLYSDFRAGWREGQDESRRMGLYRQKYCGCIFSERDRFCKKGTT